MNQATLERMAQNANLSPQVLRTALEWLVTLWSREASEEDLRALSRWRQANADHERAWQQLQTIDQRFSGIDMPAAAKSLRAARQSRSRRNGLKALGWLAVGSAMPYAAIRFTGMQQRFADLRTATGEIRQFPLPDGSHVTLNTGSALDLQWTATARTVQLLSGEVFIATAADSAALRRPFRVNTALGSLEPLGTRFNVRLHDQSALVSVEAGAVLVHPALAASAVRVGSGEQLRFWAHGAAAVTKIQGTPSAWTRKMLVSERMRLEDFTHELSRYRPGVLRCDPSVAELVVSGTYPLPDTERVLRALEAALPIRVRRRTPYWVTIESVQ